MSATDLLGHPLNDDEREVFEIYERLKALAAREGLAPCVAANARFALAVMWQVVNDLDLEHEQLDHLGV